jgi:GntR family transcriptional regulator/MocR family aminotransferase
MAGYSFRDTILSLHPTVKIQLQGQLAIDRTRAESLSLQIVHQLQEAIETGRVARGTRLPSTRSLARSLGVSRNTVLAAYDELNARGLVRSRRGAGIYVSASVGDRGFDPRRVMREAQYPTRSIAIRDQDGTPLTLTF